MNNNNYYLIDDSIHPPKLEKFETINELIISSELTDNKLFSDLQIKRFLIIPYDNDWQLYFKYDEESEYHHDLQLIGMYYRLRTWFKRKEINSTEYKIHFKPINGKNWFESKQEFKENIEKSYLFFKDS